MNSLPVERDLIQSSGDSGDLLNNDPQRIDEEENEDDDTHNSSIVATKKGEDGTAGKADDLSNQQEKIGHELELLKEAEKEMF